jgi:hypothetical protein
VLVFIVALFLFVTILPAEHNDYGFVAACFITGLFSWHLGNKWNNVQRRIFVDEATGQNVIIKGNHSLFWIKMQYWGVIFSIIGIIVLFQNSIMAAIIASIILVSIIVYFYMNGNKNRHNLKKHESIVIQKEKTGETESEEKLIRKQEKEDHSRFMPPY